MTSQTALPTLAELPFYPYLNAEGGLPMELQRQIGIYAIFDHEQFLQYVGYSRDVFQSLRQHLVRQPNGCWWYKVQTIERPSRSVLENLRQAWMAESDGFSLTPEAEAAWVNAIDAKKTMTAEEQAEYAALGEVAQVKYLKKIARRLEAEIVKTLEARGVNMELRFNPKLKEEGLLDLK
ncbi:MAG: GIY-YIG nuclease family protein [Leptolyngbya sp. SIO1D8]|nr:GIY-YIG nuclease family protein [Leptolyngbya sp. SIO1D8]